MCMPALQNRIPILKSHRPSSGTGMAAEIIGQEDLERAARRQEERLAEMAQLQELSFEERGEVLELSATWSDF
ncbi:hypothetical protein J4Q44_G00320300 [Coregonus suidteri]|uniref:Uncharacterized protein n=1 Tax=Coregonus suidteri TaxID=861788 RepID=A0AAN8KU07_9TELE